MELENVVNKIRKLLRLQFNAEKIGSTGEAFQAAKMVKKLLFEYNLSLGDIGSEEEGVRQNIVESEDMTANDKYGNYWKKSLLHVIAENNLCSIYTRTYNGKMFIIGAEENVIVVKEFYVYLLKVFRRLAIERFNEAQNEAMRNGQRYTEKGKNLFFRSYLEGVSVGLQENYDSMKPTSEETALVVCHKDMIADYLNDSKYKMDNRHHRQRRREVLGEAYEQGQEDGRKVSLNKQLSDMANKKALLQHVTDFWPILAKQVCWQHPCILQRA
jgi:hypothetical protein